MTTIPVSFVGGSSYQVVSPSTIQISIPKIVNDTSTGTTGSLQVELWYTTSPYVGGTIVGQISTTIPYTNVLGPSQYFSPNTQYASYAPPDSSHTFATLALEEWDGSAYVVEDFLDYVSPGSTAPPIPGSAQPVLLHGKASQYQIASNGSSYSVRDTVAGRDGTITASAGSEMVFTDGTGISDPTGTAENVARLYYTILGRGPDALGLNGWTANIDQAHVPLSAVANSLATSMEFLQTYGALSNDDFVRKLYVNALGRPADLAGQQAWEGALATGTTRGQVAMGFAESAEERLRTLSVAGDKNDAEAYRLYKAALARAPDRAGLLGWSDALANGATPGQVAQGFISSPEFQQKYGGLNPSDFIATLYVNALGRTADAGGLQGWVNALQQGTSKADILVGFSDSQENRLQTSSATHDSWVFLPS